MVVLHIGICDCFANCNKITANHTSGCEPMMFKSL